MRKRILKFSHLHVWRRLPRGARRAALLRGSALIAPRPTLDAKAAAPIIVVGPLRAASGLGQGARACHDALKKAGLPVYGVDLTRALMQDDDYSGFEFADGRNLIGEGTLFLHVGSPLVPFALVCLGRELVANKRIVAHWVWELPELPNDWRLGVPYVHEIWAPSQFAADAIRSVAGQKPIHVLLHPIELPREWCPVTPEGDAPFTVLTIFNVASSFERKNPCAVIRAFRQAFGNDPGTRLIVKYANAYSYPSSVELMQEAAQGASNITFIGETMDAAGVDGLYAKADVVMSLHRAEGFGLVVAEGMLRGLPVIATNWSGNTDFLNPEVGIPIDYTLIPARDPQDTYELPNINWANASVNHAAEALRELRTNRALRERLGAAAQLAATRLFSPQSYAERAKELLGL